MAIQAAQEFVTIIGTSAGETLTGTAGTDSISALAGDDFIFSLGGSDTIDGGAGNDTIAFSGALADYSVTQDAKTKVITIRDMRSGSPDGTKFVANVESYIFADGAYTAAAITNVAPTALTLTGGSLKENSAAGAAVGTLKGVDPNTGDVLTYSLLDNAGGRFVVNAATGAITVASGAMLDFETTPQLSISARVTDKFGLSYDKVFTITLTNVNEAPTALTLTGGSIAENSAGGSVVGTVQGSDPDTGATLTYSLTNNGGGKFVIDAATGVITVAQGAVLDFEKTPQITIAAKATDQGGLSFTKNFTVSLTNVNEAPTALTLSGGTIKENSAAGALVGTLKGADSDKGDVLSYSLTDDANGRFVVDAATGVIKVAQGAALDFETTPQIMLTARATDLGGLAFDKLFTVNLTNVSGLLNGNAGSNSLIGSREEDSIAGLAGNDSIFGGAGNDTIDGGDGNDVVIYSGARSQYSITMDAPTGKIIVTDVRSGSPDGSDVVSNVESFSFADGAYAAAAITNVAPTGLTLTDGALAENSTAGTVVGALKGSDPNTGDVLTYSLLDNANGRFVVDATTGLITVARNAVLDFEVTPQLSITARVTDPWGLTYSQAFTIDVTNVNEAPTALTLSGTSLQKVNPEGTAIGTLHGTDPDASSILTYSLTFDADGLFTVDATSGQISVAQGAIVDFGMMSEISIAARVTDQGGLSIDQTFTVTQDGVQSDIHGVISGTAGSDIIYGTIQSDYIKGLAGNDFIYSSGGGDIIDGGEGNDTVALAGSASDYLVTTDAASGVKSVRDLRAGTSNESITLLNVENVVFNSAAFTTPADTQYIFTADYNVRWSDAREIARSLGGDLASITNQQENVFIGNVLKTNPDLMLGGWGPNIGLYQSSKADEPKGNWVWVNGEDVIFQGWGGGEPNNAYSDEDYAQFNPGGWNDQTDFLNNPNSGLITQLDPNNSLLNGTQWDDYIVGGSINNLIEGGAGNDTLSGGSGADTFFYSVSGFGQDVITDFDATSSAHDTLHFAPTVFADWNTLLSATRQVGSDLLITSSFTDTITLKNVTLASFTQSNVGFGM